MSTPSNINLGKDFRKNEKSLLPVSFRVTPAEKAQLLKDAGPLALSAYIRQELLGDQVAERKKRYVKKQRKPDIDHAMLAKLLGTCAIWLPNNALNEKPYLIIMRSAGMKKRWCGKHVSAPG